MNTVLLATVLTLVITENASSQTCLWRDTLHLNPNSPSYNYTLSLHDALPIFCRKAYILRFDWYVISTPYYSHDTVIVYHWTNIDTQFVAIRAAFQNLEDSVGLFTLTKQGADISDTGSDLSHIFILRFDSLMRV